MMPRGAISTLVSCSSYRRAFLNAVFSKICPTLQLGKPGYLLKASYCRNYSVSRINRSNFAATTEPSQGFSTGGLQFVTDDQFNENQEGFPCESPTPWYLQIESPRRQNPPLLDRQKLPRMPPDPPPLLMPMLEHISVDLGLDDLTLLDLRDIDPPPALGANLLMVLGTARSEKHLHVSADRFCRWLKTNHKLNPYADGLLGRGELKLKLRRKARRARLLSGVGSSDSRNIDDGIRTRWICVNVGNIPDGNHARKSRPESEGFVGFGGEADGTKLVIQMLTEEKREELDFEGLWGKVLRRQKQSDESIAEVSEQLPLVSESTAYQNLT